jgi:Domain of unknown function (DUF4397)
MRRVIAVLTVALGAFVGLVVADGPAQAANTATVYAVHGIPNTPVNVFVNGKSTIPNFQPGTVAGPLQLAPGSYQVTIFPASNTAGTGTPVISATASLTAGQNVSLVAHLDASGKPTLTPYVNNTAAVAAGKARLVVRHDAAAPAVDVRADGTPVFKGLTNPNEASAEVGAGSVKADVVLAGTSTVVIGPATLDLAEGSQTIVYAIGSASGKTLGLVTQSMTGLWSSPNGVPGGTGGQAAHQDGLPGWAVGLTGAGLLLAAAGAVRLRRVAVAQG